MNVFLSHPKLDVLYNSLLDDFEHAQNHPKVEVLYDPLCIIHFWMILSMLVNHPKVGWVGSPDHHHLGSPEHVLSVLVAPQDQE